MARNATQMGFLHALRFVTDKDFGGWRVVAGVVANGVGTLPALSEKEDRALLFRRCFFDADKGGFDRDFFIRIRKILLHRNTGKRKIGRTFK